MYKRASKSLIIYMDRLYSHFAVNNGKDQMTSKKLHKLKLKKPLRKKRTYHMVKNSEA